MIVFDEYFDSVDAVVAEIRKEIEDGRNWTFTVEHITDDKHDGYIMRAESWTSKWVQEMAQPSPAYMVEYVLQESPSSYCCEVENG